MSLPAADARGLDPHKRLTQLAADRWDEEDGLPSLDVYDLAQTPDGYLWLATGDGLVRFDGVRFTAFHSRNTPAFTAGQVFALDAGSDGRLWIGAGDGSVLVRDGRRIERLIDADPAPPARFPAAEVETFTKVDGLASTRMRAVHLEADGTLWVGTSGGGLSRFRDGKFVSYTRAEGLLGDDVWGILADGEGHFWLSGDGVSRIARRDFDDYDAGRIPRLRPEAFDAPGFDRVECCVAGGSPGLWRGGDGRLWFPGAKGIAAVDSRRLADRYRLPPAVVESIVADGAALDLGTEPVPPGVADLRIAFTSPRLSAAERLSFRYRLAGFGQRWTEAGSRRVARLERPLPAVEADRVHLWQVLVNLIRNAIEAMEGTPAAERRVLVRTEADGGGGVRVSVRDSGAGFGGEEGETLFTPFHSTKPEGLGMGLAISKSIVEAHGGRISARQNPDRGATVEFTLPAAPPAED